VLHWAVLAALQYLGLTSGNKTMDKTRRELLSSQGAKEIKAKTKIGCTAQMRTGPEICSKPGNSFALRDSLEESVCLFSLSHTQNTAEMAEAGSRERS